MLFGVSEAERAFPAARARLQPAIAGLALALALGACGGAPQTDAQQANDLLAAGLKAQAAGHNAEAADDYRKVLAHDPRNAFAYYDLGVIAQQAGNNTEAEADYRAALQFKPEFDSALFNLAIIRTAVAPQEAVDLYQHVIRLKPNNASAHLNLGFVFHTMGKDADAQTEFRAAIALDPKLTSRIPAELLPSPSP